MTVNCFHTSNGRFCFRNVKYMPFILGKIDKKGEGGGGGKKPEIKTMADFSLFPRGHSEGFTESYIKNDSSILNSVPL